jgi:hypothetical protein
MRTPHWTRSAAGFLLLLCVASLAYPVRAAAEALNQQKIHYDYNNGDFDAVDKAILGFLKKNPIHSREDSVFIAKHLAVIYAANPKTREKGRYYMFRLLDLVPTARIVDMFVSEEIDRIFEKVKEERETQRAGTASAAPAPEPAPAAPVAAVASAPASGAASGRSRNFKYWVAGGVGAAAVGLALIYFANQDPVREPDKVYVVKKP